MSWNPETIRIEVFEQFAAFPPRYEWSLQTHSIIKNKGRYGRAVSDQNGVVYPSQAHAARTLHLDRGNVSRVLSGQFRHTHGYTFHYLEE